MARNALVTGSRRGLGAAIAIGLAEAGANVAVTAVIRVREASALIFERWDAVPPISPATSLKHLPAPL